MKARCLFYFALALVLGAVTPAVASLAFAEASPQGPLAAWFFALPQAAGEMLSPGQPLALPARIAIYTVQYFAILGAVAALIARLQKPKGPLAERAFHEAATEFHDL